MLLGLTGGSLHFAAHQGDRDQLFDGQLGFDLRPSFEVDELEASEISSGTFPLLQGLKQRAE